MLYRELTDSLALKIVTLYVILAQDFHEAEAEVEFLVLNPLSDILRFYAGITISSFYATYCISGDEWYLYGIFASRMMYGHLFGQTKCYYLLIRKI